MLVTMVCDEWENDVAFYFECMPRTGEDVEIQDDAIGFDAVNHPLPVNLVGNYRVQLVKHVYDGISTDGHIPYIYLTRVSKSG